MITAVLTRVDRRAHVVAKTAAALATVSALIHLFMVPDLVRAPSGVIMLALAGLCAVCARTLWVRPDAGAWVMMGVVSGVMIVVHAAFMANEHTGAMVHSAHATVENTMAPAGVAGGHGSALMTAAMAIAVAEAVVAMGMSLRLRVVSR